MKLNRKQTLLAFICIMLLLSISSYVQRHYFFNPLTFKQDKITYLPWAWYKKPLQVEYLVSGDRGDRLIVQDPAEINFVISELKKATRVDPSDSTYNRQEGKPIITIDIRRVEDGSNAPGVVLLHAQSENGLLSVRTGEKMEPIQVTPELKNRIESRMAEAK